MTLQEHLDEYLAMRRSLGYKLYKEGVRLPKFLSFLESRKVRFISASVALDWARQVTGTSPQERLKIVRGFARYMTSFDVRTEVPADTLLPKIDRRPRPHIYSDDEVQRLMKAAYEYEPDRPLRTYYCLLGLLAVSGLRSGEALELRVSFGSDPSVHSGSAKSVLGAAHCSTLLRIVSTFIHKFARNTAVSENCILRLHLSICLHRSSEETFGTGTPLARFSTSIRRANTDWLVSRRPRR
jgi:integrase